MPKARKKTAPADAGDVHTDELDLEVATGDIVGPPAPAEDPRDPYDRDETPDTRPALIGSREAARAQRTDDWIEVRCTVANVHTSVGKMLSGQCEFLPPEEVEALDKLDLVKRVT